MWSQPQKWLVAGIASLGLASTSVAFGQASEQGAPSYASPSQPNLQPIPKVSESTPSYPRGWAAFPQGKQPLEGMGTSPSPQYGSLATPQGVISQVTYRVPQGNSAHRERGSRPGSRQPGQPYVPWLSSLGPSGIYGLVPGQPGQALTGAAPGALAPGELGPGAGLGGTEMGGAGAPGGPAAGAPMAGAGAAAGGRALGTRRARAGGWPGRNGDGWRGCTRWSGCRCSHGRSGCRCWRGGTAGRGPCRPWWRGRSRRGRVRGRRP